MDRRPSTLQMSHWKRRRVVLLIQTATDWSRQVLSGIARFANERGGWDFYLESRGFDEEMSMPRDWQAEGAIVRLSHPKLRQSIVRRRIPAVNVSWLENHSATVPKAVSDEARCGEVAARFFIRKGYHTFAYVTSRRPGYSDRLERQFRTTIGDRQFHRFDPDPAGTTVDRGRLARWLRSLPKPVAILVWDSSLGHEVVLAGINAGIAIPAQMSVLCLEADPLVSSLCPIPLSFIDQDGDAVGYRAAELLERLMFGQEPPLEPVLVPPLRIVERLSTDAVAVRDPLLARALQFIRDRATSAITVADLERHLDLTRRQLEHCFTKDLGHTPAVELRNVRLSLAKELLRTTDLPLDVIAARSGFGDAAVLIRCFQREVGQTPGAYRRAPAAIRSLE